MRCNQRKGVNMRKKVLGLTCPEAKKLPVGEHVRHETLFE